MHLLFNKAVRPVSSYNVIALCIVRYRVDRNLADFVAVADVAIPGIAKIKLCGNQGGEVENQHPR
jgi:hypothetical protein